MQPTNSPQPLLSFLSRCLLSPVTCRLHLPWRGSKSLTTSSRGTSAYFTQPEIGRALSKLILKTASKIAWGIDCLSKNAVPVFNHPLGEEMFRNVQCKLPLAQLWILPAPSITSYSWEKQWRTWLTLEPLGYKCYGSGWKVQWKPVPFDAWEGTNVQTTISLKCDSGSRPKINEGIFTELSTGLLAHAVFEIITPFWKAVHNRKCISFETSQNQQKLCG